MIITAVLVITAAIAALVCVFWVLKCWADAWMAAPGDEDEPTEPISLPDDDGYLSEEERLLDEQVAARNAEDIARLETIERLVRKCLDAKMRRWLVQLDQSPTDQQWALLCSGSYPAVTT